MSQHVLKKNQEIHTLCAKLGMTVIQILSAPTGRCGYAVIRKWWNNRISAIDCVRQVLLKLTVCLRYTHEHAWR
jgi:hypothetical protein